MKNLIPLVVVLLIALGFTSKPAQAVGSGPPCLTHAQMSGLTSGLDYSDETINYIFWGVVGDTMTTEIFAADIQALYDTNNAIRWNLGLAPH